MTLVVESRGAGPNLILLHGWAFGCCVWDRVIDELADHFRVSRVELPGYPRYRQSNRHSFESLLETLAPALADKTHVLGWSLGGMLALGLAERLPDQLGKRILVATNLRFTSCDSWPHAMRPEVLSKFRENLATDARATVNRFAALVAQGSVDAAAELRYFRQLFREHGIPECSALDDGLAILECVDLRSVKNAMNSETLFIFGENDALVPAEVAADVRKNVSGAHTVVFENTGHAPFLSHRQRFVDTVRGFLS